MKKYFEVAFWILLTCLLIAIHFQPGVWLLGWDNILPELNLPLNLQRSLTAVWQGYRGLGVYDGLAHAANLTHTLYIWALSWLFDPSQVRLVFITMTYTLGGAGMYYFTRHFARIKRLPAAIAATAYMVNIGIIQMYQAPLEVFAVHFAALPWICLFLVRYIQKPQMASGLLLLIGSFLFSQQGFVPTVFIAAFMAFAGIALALGRQQKDYRPALTGLTLILVANLFWLLPFVHGVPRTAPEIQKTHINQLSSKDLYEQNRAHGNIGDVLMLRGFMLDLEEFDVLKNRDALFMDKWVDRAYSLPYTAVWTVMLLIAGVGMTESLRRKKDINAMLVPLVVGIFFLANDTPVIAQLHDGLRFIIPTFAEAFRIPFTKCVTITAFGMAFWIGYGSSTIMRIMHQKSRQLLVGGAVFCALLWAGLPILQGELYSRLIRVNLPSEYLATMKYLSEQSATKRIALFPLHTFWNWQYRDFGQRGSDFWWYGVPQPIMMRPFDPWSTRNEAAFVELQTAFQNQDIVSSVKLLETYALSYILVDEHIVTTTSTKPIDYDKLHLFLKSFPGMTEVFKSGKISVYEHKKEHPAWYVTQDSPLSVYPSGAAAYGRVNNFLPLTDTDFITTGEVVSGTPATAKLLFPFPKAIYNDNAFMIDAGQLPKSLTLKGFSGGAIPLQDGKDYRMIFPSLAASDQLIPVKFSLVDDGILAEIVYPELTINSQSFSPPGETIHTPYKVLKNPEGVFLAEKGQRIKTGFTTYVHRNFVHIIRVTQAGRQEFLTFDSGQFKKDALTYRFQAPKIDRYEMRFPTIHNDFSAFGVEKQMIETKFVPEPQTRCRRAHYDVGIDTTGSGSSEQEWLEIEAACGEVTASHYVDNMFHNVGYAVTFEAEVGAQSQATLSIDNPAEKRSESENVIRDGLNTLILPPISSVHKGYSLQFRVVSRSNTLRTLKVRKVNVTPITYNFLTHSVIERLDATIPTNTQGSAQDSDNIGNVNNTENIDKMLVLNQAYDPGWKAYYNGIELGGHTEINGWAQGWDLEPPQAGLSPSDSSITFAFWPQYLEYIGFGILGLVVLYMIYATHRQASHHKKSPSR